jgi:hypothetical protein
VASRWRSALSVAAEARSVGRQEPVIHPHDTLIALAEVSAAFAGFSGIVAALGYRSASDWSATDRMRFANLLSVAVAATLLAFLPVVLSHFALSDSAVWAWASAALGLFGVSFLILLVRRAIAIARGELEQPNRWMGLAWVIGMGAVALGQLANIATMPTPRASALYVAGILVLLALSGLQFVLLALHSVSPEP